jgi:alpha-mannosidase
MKPENSKDYTIHMIGNAHIDPIWLWTVEEGRKEVSDTCLSAIDRMTEAPAFTFTRSSASAYRWIEEDDPELFKKIQQRVREGRWSIVNGWWEQPDCNTPAGESFVRHSLYGKRYFREKFGVDVTVGYNVDSFGHNGMLPQILKKSGLKYYIFFRPSPEEKELPGSVFWWESPDGSRVLACRPPLHYCSYGEMTPVEKRIRAVTDLFQTPLKDVLCFYGVGNHGGGPTKEDIKTILRLSAESELPRIEFSTVERFFERVLRVTKNLPVVSEDLQYFSRGCYTSLSAVKKYNRKCETLLLTAEKFSTLAYRFAGSPYPLEELTSAWKNVLFNQFHDALGGTCIPAAYPDVYTMYEKSLSDARRALDTALHALASNVHTLGHGLPILVFNQTSWPRSSLVEISLPVKVPPLGLQIHDDEGKPVYIQEVKTNTREGEDGLNVTFLADVPALGYRLYRAVYEYTESAARKKFFFDVPLWKLRGWKDYMPPAPPVGPVIPAQTSPLSVTGEILENEYYRIKIDAATGCLSSIHDKANGVEVLSAQGNRLLVLTDTSDTWGMKDKEWRDVIGEFRPEGRFEITELGPVRIAVRLRSRYENSTAIQDILLSSGSRQIECRLTVDWREKHKMLKVSFPLNLRNPIATCQIPYGFTVRPTNGEEQPCQAWIDVGGLARDDKGQTIPYGMSLLNNCKYGFDVKGAEMRMTILRSPLYAYFTDATLEPGKNYEYVDQGIQTLVYALLPHAGDWRDAETVRAAEELNNPLIALVEPLHRGKLGPLSSFLECSPSNVVCTVLKKAEDSDNLIIRLYETSGRNTTATVAFPSLKIRERVRLGHHEIKTLKLSRGKLTEVDSLEKKIHDR